MPVSEIQAQVLRQIAANRSPESYLAGATVLNRADDAPRYSHDLGFFHDISDHVAQSAEKDAADSFGALQRHRGSVRGAWPTVSPGA